MYSNQFQRLWVNNNNIIIIQKLPCGHIIDSKNLLNFRDTIGDLTT